MTSVPYWRLSGFYLCYFATLGALAPYWPLYLQSLELTPAEIGELLALTAISRIIAPNIWGWIADRHGKRMNMVRLASLLAMLSFCGVFLHTGYGWLLIVMSLFSFFWNAALPQFEAVTFAHLGTESRRYGHIRLWGSIGFIIAVMGLGRFLEYHSISELPLITFMLFAAIWLVSLSIPDKADTGTSISMRQEPFALGTLLCRPAVLALLSTCLLMQAGHSPY